MSKISQIIENRSESLNLYLEQINESQPLTKDEERELDRRIMSGDIEARNELIVANLRFVLRCALEMFTPNVPLEELVAAGNYGLSIAATRYDPSYPTRFCSFAVHHIRMSIREAIKAWTCQVAMPNWAQASHACLSLDETHEEDEDNWSRDLIDLIPAEPQSSEVRYRMEEEKEHLRSFLSKWYYPSDVRLLMDFIQMTYDGYSLSDLAKKHNLPQKQMRSIINDLFLKYNRLQAALKKAA